MADKRVTIIIPHWNRRFLLEKSIPSLKNQTFRALKILVVDNGSTDDSMEWLEENHPDVERLILPENIGYAPGANKGLELAETEYVSFYSNDVIADPDWLTSLVDAMDNNHDMGFCVGKILWSDTPGIIYAAGDHYGINGFPYNIGQNEEDKGQYDSSREVLVICTAASLFRRQALLEVGSYDDRYFAHGEDTDLCLRLQLGGWRGAYIPSGLTYHVGSASSDPESKDFIERTNRNGMFTFIKNYPWPIMKRHWPELLLSFLFSLKLTIHPGSAIKGRLCALLRIKEFMRDRKRIQGSRKCTLRDFERMLLGKGTG